MFTIYNSQITQMGLPFLKKLMQQAVETVMEEYPRHRGGRSESELLKQVNLRADDMSKLSFKADETVLSYLIICLRYSTDYETLIRDYTIRSILLNEGFHETEKVYLMDEILNSHGL